MGKGQIFRISANSIVLLALCVTSSRGQEKANGTGPVYRVGVDRKLAAVSYPYGSAPTKIDFTGSALLPEAKGVAVVRSGRTEIEATFEKLPPPTHFGWQYPTYVLWAVTPEGACQNLGELVLQESNRARLQAATDLQTFALMVTAEPYAIVRQPSTMVVLENQARPDIAGRVAAVEPNPALKSAIEYKWDMGPAPADTAKASEGLDRASRELHEAVNAVTIARLAGADRFAPEPLASAQRALAKAQDLYSEKGDPKLVIQNSREAVQRGDGARTIAERRRQEPGANREDAAGAGSHGEPTGEALQPLSRSLLHEVVDGAFPAQDTQRGLVITLPDTDFDGAALLHSIVQKLGPVASTLTTQPNLHIDVEGYMDSAELASWDRAESVRSALLKAGLQGSQISMRGGMTKPAGPGEDRRVQIVISGGAPAGPTAPPPDAASVARPATETVPAVAANPEPTRVASPATANRQASEVAVVQPPPAAPVAPVTPPPAPVAAPVAPVTPPPAPVAAPVVQSTPPQAESAAPAPPASLPVSAIPAAPVPAQIQPPTPQSVIAPAKAAGSHQAQGRKFLQEERYDDAVREFTEAVTLNPSLSLAYNGRGYAYYRLKNYQAAVGDFDTAIRLNPGYANAYLNRSACRRALGDKAGAASDAAKARDLSAATTARSAGSGSSPGL